VFECEGGRLFGGFVRGTDAQALGGAYLHLPSGSAQWTFYPTTIGAWSWTRTAANDDLQRLRFDGLAAGPHTLVIGPGESRARCDRVVVTSDVSFTPPAP
jgi:hypothetical protein